MRSRLTAFLENDPHVMDVLAAVRDCGPAGAIVAAGFVRNRVWDSFYEQNHASADADIDVVYFDKADTTKESEQAFEAALEQRLPTGLWQVRNQARMHSFGGYPPFESLEHGLMHWAETATTVGARLRKTGNLEIVSPFGLDDLFNHILRITPQMKRHDAIGFDVRLERKNWLKRWPDLTVIRE